ncbi:MAG: hypothetical protein JWM26_3057 [Betaproteobacteria bacterium]|nr:hypothetical protein [Betaproteobacteria bacterium]
MFGTWDRFPAATGRRHRDSARRHDDPFDRFLVSVDRLIYLTSAGLAVCLIAIVMQ